MNESLYEGIRKNDEFTLSRRKNFVMNRRNDQENKHTCSKCGQIHDKLFQNDTCKNCLMDSFTRVKKIIDIYRTGYGENIAKNVLKNN